MSTPGPLDAISLEALEIIKEFKAKYSQREVEEMERLGYLAQNLLAKEDFLRMEQFSRDFAKYIHAAKAVKMPQQQIVDDRSIEERFPAFAASLAKAPQPYAPADDERNTTILAFRRKSTPW